MDKQMARVSAAWGTAESAVVAARTNQKRATGLLLHDLEAVARAFTGRASGVDPSTALGTLESVDKARDNTKPSGRMAEKT